MQPLHERAEQPRLGGAVDIGPDLTCSLSARQGCGQRVLELAEGTRNEAIAAAAAAADGR